MPRKNLSLDGVSEADIILNKKLGRIYVADFGKDTQGRYISSVLPVSHDAKLQISTRIELRLTYIVDHDKIEGVRIKKVDSSKGDQGEITLSKVDCHKLQEILNRCSGLDYRSITNKSLILDESIVKDPDKLKTFLTTIISDSKGLAILQETLSKLDRADLEQLSRRKEAVASFKNMLNDKNAFNGYKSKYKLKQDENVWSHFFKQNKWIFGSDITNFTTKPHIDESNIPDILSQDRHGYADIIELKLPSMVLWAKDCTDNMCSMAKPLSSALVQSMRYINQLAARANDNQKVQEVGEIVKPRLTLVCGRDKDWEKPQRNSLRVLNGSLHDITVLTYDHILANAESMISANEDDEVTEAQ